MWSFWPGPTWRSPEGIPVDHQMGTADPDIFAAGDCAYAYHLLTGQRAGYHIWPAAVAQGRIAGANLAGAGLTYDGLLPQNSLSLRGFHIITGGLGPLDADGLRGGKRTGRAPGPLPQPDLPGGKAGGPHPGGGGGRRGDLFSVMAQQLPVAGPVQPGRMWG